MFVADNESIRRCDIIIIDKIISKGIILDTTFRFKISSAQPEDKDEEKITI